MSLSYTLCLVREMRVPADEGDDMTERVTDHDRPPGLPRWVKLLTLGAVVAVAVLVTLMLLVGGDHGPGMHG